MAVSKKIQRYDQYLLRGNLRNEGFERWRYIFSAVSKETGQSRIFFVEMYLVNPAVSPDAAVIAQKSRLDSSAEDFQYALAGTPSALTVGNELAVKPSYILVKCGAFGKNGKQFNRFLPASEISWNKNTGKMNVANFEFSSEMLYGRVCVTEKDIQLQPELLCNCGEMNWNLNFEKIHEVKPFEFNHGSVWVLSAAKAAYSGTISFDGEDFAVIPKDSYGYHDKSWGTSFGSQFFHLSASRLSDIITGTSLLDSSIAVETDPNGKLKFHLKIEDQIYRFDNSNFFQHCKENHECIQVPSSEGQKEKLHWSLSIHKGRTIIDIDVYCDAEELFVRDYEIPQGKRTLLKVLSGGTGHGEIKIFNKVKQNLEMLHHVGIYDCICEYGQNEEVGK